MCSSDLQQQLNKLIPMPLQLSICLVVTLQVLCSFAEEEQMHVVITEARLAPFTG